MAMGCSRQKEQGMLVAESRFICCGFITSELALHKGEAWKRQTQEAQETGGASVSREVGSFHPHHQTASARLPSGTALEAKPKDASNTSFEQSLPTCRRSAVSTRAATAGTERAGGEWVVILCSSAV